MKMLCKNPSFGFVGHFQTNSTEKLLWRYFTVCCSCSILLCCGCNLLSVLSFYKCVLFRTEICLSCVLVAQCVSLNTMVKVQCWEKLVFIQFFSKFITKYALFKWRKYMLEIQGQERWWAGHLLVLKIIYIYNTLFFKRIFMLKKGKEYIRRLLWLQPISLSDFVSTLYFTLLQFEQTLRLR